MGALLSLPLMAVPGIGTMFGFAASCCGAATCSAICSACGKCQSSMATRIAYAFILLINSIMSWIMLTRWALNKLEHLTFDFLPISCDGEKCHGWVAVHRINFALGLFHIVLALLLLGVRSTKNPRAGIQNGYWGPKIIIWLSLVVLSFFIPEQFFFVWGSYFAFFGAMLFLLLGLILLVDLAHTWAELCLQKIEEYDSNMWRGLLIGSTVGMYVSSIAMTVVMYIFFAHSGCAMNQAAITVNLILLLIISAVSVQPSIQASNPRAGLAQAAMVAVYCTYLTLSAVSMEPDDKQCNPLIRARGTRTASIVLGAIITMLTIAYTTTRAATQGIALGSSGSNNNYTRLGQDDNEHGLVTQQPGLNRREMRAEALRAAVESGSLPASALDDDSDDESDDGKDSKDDERGSTQYNYALFHIIFLLATNWVATLLTQNLDPEGQDDLAPVGRTYWYSWVKIISSWVHQIQSGQVIVDLCSVVKELVENSLDAGATSLDIRFKNNGLDLIEVQDNGGGISPDDYESIALKHYTSKLSTFDDLSSLQTFGFRGEALSSLCALSTFRITTAQAHQAPKASRLDFEVSGKVRSTQVVAGQKGTIVSVENLFHRLPVRRRELEKNIKREYGKVLGLLHAYACISTGVRFNMRNQMPKGKSVVVFATQGNATMRENISNVYGAKTLLALTPLDLELEFQPSAPGRRLGSQATNKIFIQGFISKPVYGEGRQTPDRQMFFVNSRPCGLPQISKAFNEVYKSFNISQSPFVFANLQMDTSSYDVNVSPDKRSILLHEAGALIESLKSSLTELFEGLDQTVPQSQLSTLQSRLKHPGGTGISAIRSSRADKPIETEPENLGTIEDNDQSRAERSREPQTAFQRFALGSGGQRADSMDVPDSQPSGITEPSTHPSGNNTAQDAVELDFTSKDQTGDQVASSEIQTPRGDAGAPPAQPQSVQQYDEKTAAQPSTVDSAEKDHDSSQSPIHKLQGSNIQHTPSVVQSAFDRMRPNRPPPQIAIVTVGNKTVTSTIGSPQPKRKLHSTDFGPSVPYSRPKRRIHTSGPKHRIGQSLLSFAAPGTQLAGQAPPSSDGEEEISDDDAGSGASVRGSDTEIDVDGSENGNEVEDLEDTNDNEPPGSDSDQSYVDEEEKKVREEAKVAELIRAAEEQAAVPSEQSLRRANKISKRSIKDSTVELMSTIDGSIERIKAQMECLREQLQTTHNGFAEPQELVDDTSSEQESPEAQLSLAVSKDDFAKMRIIGQFNLGFILATRPGIATSHATSKSSDELFIIDQHASDEKYNFERLQAETVVQNQRLVKPKTLDLTAVEEEVILDNLPALEKNGFVVEVDDSGDEPIGRRCKLVSLPLSKEVVFNTRDLEELIVLLSEAPHMMRSNNKDPGSSLPSASPQQLADQYIPRPSKVRKMFAMRACRSSIMIGKTLTMKQMEKVVTHMGMIDKPWNCPHGRPTMRHLMSLGKWDEWSEWQDAEYDHDEDEETQHSQDGLNFWRHFLEEHGDLEED
ncbi:hypothetical protein AJ80_04521 [Polytolypa hystricis UAMH7299]|uniref:DNA mismatch repair protein PMS1 n=1 Tax=Polytolypa hystricis (strain UAMH7299) TaxID=1447883 RepID=A0A2B7YBD3_POLH7|nr:hypothetical protein AJ80_04521 [Polytolypa hystricis UAMH7299]